MKLLSKTFIIVSCFVNIGCTTIGQQIINRDGTIQIKQENINFGATNGGSHTNEVTSYNVQPVKIVSEPSVQKKQTGTDKDNLSYEKYLMTPRDRLVAKTGIDIIEYRESETQTDIENKEDTVNVNVYTDTINIESVILGAF